MLVARLTVFPLSVVLPELRYCVPVVADVEPDAPFPLYATVIVLLNFA